MYCIKDFMIQHIYEDPTCKQTIILPIIKPKFPATRNCSVPVCESYNLVCSKKISTGTTKVNTLSEKEVVLTRDKYELVYFVSTDHFISKTPVGLPTGYYRESSDQRFQGGTIYNNRYLMLIWIEKQVSIGSNQTVVRNSRFDKCMLGQTVMEVSRYHGKNSTLMIVVIKGRLRFFRSWGSAS